MEAHLFYGRFGFIGYVHEEEVALVCGEDSFERILAGVFKALADKSCAWKYTARFDLENGESVVIERGDTDLSENTFRVTRTQGRNVDSPVRMTKRQLKRVLSEAYKREN